MHLSEEEDVFLRALVKSARQKPQLIQWTDRDGSERHTTLSLLETTRLDTIARRLGCSRVELLRRIAHVPISK